MMHPSRRGCQRRLHVLHAKPSPVLAPGLLRAVAGPSDPWWCPHELWTTRLLARHAREHAVAAGHPRLSSIVQGTVCKILARHEVKPHKVRYYLACLSGCHPQQQHEGCCQSPE